MTPEEVEDIVLVVLSDMQADQGSKSVGTSTLEEIVQKMFHEAGLKTSHRRPYAAPTMVWWNMRTTNGSPCATSSKNTVMMSGPRCKHLVYCHGEWYRHLEANDCVGQP